MPTRKQRRRQQKLRRHEYEDVWVDAEGNVLPAEEGPEAAPSTNGARARAGDDKSATTTKAVRTSGGRVVPEPSWGRVLKRGLFFAPLMFVLISILPGGDDFPLAQKLFLTVQYVLMLIVFMYLTERLTYRVWRRRQGAAEKR